jgi:hypothetical protein
MAYPPIEDETYARLFRLLQRALKCAESAVSGQDKMRAIRVVTASLRDINDYAKLHEDWSACDDACRANGHRPAAVCMDHAAVD